MPNFSIFISIVCFLGWSSQILAETSAAYLGKKNDPAYKIQLHDDVERGILYEIYQDKVKFKVNSFSKPIKKGDIFIVLNQQADAILGEVVVVGMSRKQTTAFANKTLQIGGGDLKELVGKLIVRLEDRDKIVIVSLPGLENPLVSVHLLAHSFVNHSVNVAMGIPLNPKIFAYGSGFSVFAPPVETARWSNYLGLLGQKKWLQKASLNIKIAAQDDEKKATILGFREMLEFIIRLPIERYFIKYFSFYYTLKNAMKDQVFLAKSAVNDEISLIIDRSFKPLGFDIAMSFFANFIFGMSLKQSNYQTFKVYDDLNKDVQTGEWAEREISLWLDFLSDFSAKMAAQVRAQIILRDVKIQNSPLIGSGENYHIVAWEQAGQLTLTYNF